MLRVRHIDPVKPCCWINVLVFGNITPAPLQSLDWFEFGARVGYRMTQLATLDVFANGIAGDNGIQTKLHAGAGIRVRF